MSYSTQYTALTLAQKLGVWEQLVASIHQLCKGKRADRLLDKVSHLPIRSSRATRTLGSYVSKAGEAICIRLQFALESDLLVKTFLHELAHACDHLSNQEGSPYRQAHGPGWKEWAVALGAGTEIRGGSEVLTRLYQDRLKTVAVCYKCGAELKRIRRLAGRRRYVHRGCGGELKPL